MAPWWTMGKGKGFGKSTFQPGPQGAYGQHGQQFAAAPASANVPGAGAMEEGWSTGVIRRLFVGKGFGFIAKDDLPTNNGRGDVFLHFSDLVDGLTSSDLAVGMRMKFRWEAARDSRGPGGRARRVSSEELSTPPAATTRHRAARTGRVYRKDFLLNMQELMKNGNEFEERRPFGTRSRAGPLASRIIFPFTIQMPQWYWDLEDERALAEANDVQRVQFLEARLDLENGADANNGETFGEGWALETWSYEEALAANQRLARAYQAPAHMHSAQWADSLPEFFQQEPLVLQ